MKGGQIIYHNLIQNISRSVLVIILNQNHFVTLLKTEKNKTQSGQSSNALLKSLSSKSK